MGKLETGVSEELVARKIAVYFNIGNTVAPEPILSLLRSRCRAASGNFMTPEQAAEKKKKKGDGGEKKAENAAARGQEAGGEPIVWQNGMVSGIVGKRMGVNGVLDLRGVPAEALAAVEELRLNGVALIDQANRGALNTATAQINGTIIAVPPDVQVVVQESIELSRAAVEAMPSGRG